MYDYDETVFWKFVDAAKDIDLTTLTEKGITANELPHICRFLTQNKSTANGKNRKPKQVVLLEGQKSTKFGTHNYVPAVTKYIFNLKIHYFSSVCY